MRPKQAKVAAQIESALADFNRNIRPLPGIHTIERRQAFIDQVLDSIRRVDFVRVVGSRGISPERMDPASDIFDPIRAAFLHKAVGHLDEAFWLVFLFVYFGKHRRTGWQLLRTVYGALGSDKWWNWSRVSHDPSAFRRWIGVHYSEIKVAGSFGNHRKYETIDPAKNRNVCDAVESYVRWVGSSHVHMLNNAAAKSAEDPRQTFEFLYQSMKASPVISFGRTARFDYLTMLAKTGLAPIEAPSAYIYSATGPLSGAKLLFGGSPTASLTPGELDPLITQLGKKLGVGMQVMEDSLCNWQKSPDSYKPFRG